MSVVPVTRGHHYVASTGHELATLAAFEALENGGNAIDAGVAAILTLGVVYSDQVSVAGVAPMIVRLAETGEVVTIAGVGGWPRALDAEAFIERHGGTIPLGVRRTVVPAAPDACIQALERWGTMTFRDVAARAVRYASHGFPRHPVMLDYVRKYADEFRRWPENVAIWMPGGEVPAPGERLVQADLGRVLQFLCDEERAAGDDRMAGLAAVRHAFYRGDIARRILAHQREHDGLLAADDLESFRCQIVPSVSRRFPLGRRGGRGSHLRRVVPGSVPAGSAFHRRGGGRRRAGVRHGWVPPYDCRDPQAHVRRQGGLSRRPGFRGRPSRYALGPRLRSGAEQGDRSPEGISRNAASRPDPRPRGIRLAGRRKRRARRAFARYVDRLRHRRSGERIVLDTLGYELGYAGGAGNGAGGVVPRRPIVGGARPPVMPRAGQTAPSHA